MIEAMEVVGNPAAQHAAGRRAESALEDAREHLAAALGAHPLEVVFTSGGTEADAIAVSGGVAARRSARPRTLIGATEHPAVLLLAREATGGNAAAEVVPVDADGELDVGALGAALGEDVGVVSVQWVNNETGVIQPVEAIADLTHRAGAWFHTDAVQAVGHLPVDVSAGPADLVSVSAHKLGGPVGIGALVVRRGVTPAPWGPGGRQEGGVRSGTQAVMLAAGFAAAAEAARAQQEVETARLDALRERLVAGILGTVPASRINGVRTSCAIVNVTVEGARADDVLLLLDRAGIDASAGSACRAGVHQPSEVLLAMGRTEAQASSSVRFSFGWTTTDADIDRVLAVLPDVVERARRASR